MSKIVNFPFNIRAVARIDEHNIVHNHLYHNCPIGKIDLNNMVYDINGNIVGRVEKSGIVMSEEKNSSIGEVSPDGFISQNGCFVGRIDGDNPIMGGAAYLLLIQGNR